MSQFKVPQNIDLQDKIVGPLTLYQFLYLLVGGLIFYTTFKTPGLIDVLLFGAPVGLLSLALAFVKINDQPFSRFLISFLFFIIHPKRRVWHNGGGAPQISLKNQVSTKSSHVTVKKMSLQQIQQFSQAMDNSKS